jgi:UDP-N-acetylmuramate--alanine ligase
MSFKLNKNILNVPYKGTEMLTEVYFIGIGGIGMSAIARFFHTSGVKVSGYDKTPTALTKELEDSGIAIHYEESIELIPQKVDMVVYTPAIPAGQKELVFYNENGYKVVKRSDALQIITESSFNICIAGTHGKTTITSMVAHLLRDTGFGCNAFLGGIAVNYGTNFWSSEKNVCVIEADEYDRSFLKLNPDIAIVTAMDADHLDIYGTKEAMEQAFIDFTGKTKADGLVIGKFGLKRTRDLKTQNYLSYSLQNESADIYGANIKMKNGGYEFDVMMKENMISNVRLNMGGMHNVENAIVAIAVASSLEIENEKIKEAVAAFRGVKRRFEYILPPVEKKEKEEWIKPVFIDDYAHHPEELRALITGAKALFKQRRCTVIFQPHLYSRTRDLAEGFAEVLDLADEVILLPIYPARELPIAGISSETILLQMNIDDRSVMTKTAVLDWLREDYITTLDKEFGEVLITAGAGDIDTLIEPIKEMLEKLNIN